MSNPMPAWKFALIAKAAVVNYANAHAAENNTEYIDMDDVDIVWAQQRENRNRAILTVIPPGDMLFEVFSDGKEMQLKVYKTAAEIAVKA